MAIDVVAALGDDALKNLWDLIIPPFPGVIDPVSLPFRVQNLTIPKSGNTPYEVHYKTQKMTKPSGKVEAENQFTFEFRVDKYWLLYKGLRNWKNTVMDTRYGTMTPDIGIGSAGSIRVPITAMAVDSNGVPTGMLWIFEGSFCQDIGDVALDYTTGDAITVTVTMGFMAMNDETV
ncbi:MAG TPA: hypothetical protein VMV86_04955 [Methanosarcinales archaeon]|nr:hypothetical protein [Methanosarcinales archaeon]